MRCSDASTALLEWCDRGAKHGMAFRLASWRQQKRSNKRNNSNSASEPASRMSAFLSHEAIQKRRDFAVALNNAGNMSLALSLAALKAVADRMNKPCLRLELLRHVFDLNGAFSLTMIQKGLNHACEAYVHDELWEIKVLRQENEELRARLNEALALVESTKRN